METELKQCRSECKKYLPLSAFGVNRKYKDKRAPYCKECNRKKSRAQLAVRRQRAGKEPVWQMGLPWDQMVLQAIKSGAHTEYAIKRRTKLSRATVETLLLDLILDRKQVVTKVSGESRLYFTRSVAA